MTLDTFTAHAELTRAKLAGLYASGEVPSEIRAYGKKHLKDAMKKHKGKARRLHSFRRALGQAKELLTDRVFDKDSLIEKASQLKPQSSPLKAYVHATLLRMTLTGIGIRRSPDEQFIFTGTKSQVINAVVDLIKSHNPETYLTVIEACDIVDGDWVAYISIPTPKLKVQPVFNLIAKKQKTRKGTTRVVYQPAPREVPLKPIKLTREEKQALMDKEAMEIELQHNSKPGQISDAEVEALISKQLESEFKLAA